MSDTKFKEGHPKKGGRKKGTKNRFMIDVQQTAFEIFKNLGGVKGATEYFKSNKQTKGQFYNIFYKMLPSNIGIDHSGEVKVPLKLIIENNATANRKDEDD